MELRVSNIHIRYAYSNAERTTGEMGSGLCYHAEGRWFKSMMGIYGSK